MRNEIKLEARGRRHSSMYVIKINGCINRLLIFKNKKRGYKILKMPIYYGGILSCLLVLVMFACMTANCEKPLIIERNNNKLISPLHDTITPVLIRKGNIGYSESYAQLHGRNMLIRTSTEWEELKTLFSNNTIDRPGLLDSQEIDFSIYQVIAIF
ncbi:MAG: hypothetical protein LBL13_02670, partial [Bacteroidales bacterium]|nr:hypothetical protein [Bacteroidales bacterium]